jgi:hypothetical protein
MVRVVRAGDRLWVCFSALRKGAIDPTTLAPKDFAGVRFDSDHSRDPLALGADGGFFVGEDGGPFVLSGDGAGNLVAAPLPSTADDLQAQVSANAASWSAELRIDDSIVGGWEHLVGMSFGHHSVSQNGDDYTWPYAAEWAGPATWAATVLGNQPLLSALTPFSATMLGPSFTLSVTGSGFVSGTQVLWNGSALPTSLVDSGHLSAEVASTLLTSAGVVTVSARSPAPGNFSSNALSLLVKALEPEVTSLSPSSIKAGAAALTLIVQGENFAPGAQVVWNGIALPTQVDSPSQLTAQVEAALLLYGQTVGVGVRNPTPGAHTSALLAFEVLPSSDAQNQPVDGRLHLPLVTTE